MSFFFFFRFHWQTVSYVEERPRKKKKRTLVKKTIEVIEEKKEQLKLPAPEPSFPYLDALIEESTRRENVIAKYLSHLRSEETRKRALERFKLERKNKEEAKRKFRELEDDDMILSTFMQELLL